MGLKSRINQVGLSTRKTAHKLIITDPDIEGNKTLSDSLLPLQKDEQTLALGPTHYNGYESKAVGSPLHTKQELPVPDSQSGNVSKPESGEAPSENLVPVPVRTRNVYSPDAVANARAALWEKAYKTLRAEKPELLLDFESIIKDDTDLPQDRDLFSSAAIQEVVAAQKRRMENKQWTYHFFDKKGKVRDTIESILSIIKSASPIISAGMDFAPAFVSIPWSFVSIVLPFITREFTEMHAAINGLKEVTCILSSYNSAEQEFLANSVTRAGFQDEVLHLYVKIFEYQALAAQHFAASTIKRLGRNVSPGSAWQDALDEVKKAEVLCHIPISGLAIRLQQTSFRLLEDLLNNSATLLKSRMDESFVRRTRNEQVIEWISTINAIQDHVEIRRRLGDDYVSSGQWLLREHKDFESWLKSPSMKMLLQGVVGTGKSSLVSMVLEYLMARADGQLAFNYCSATSSSWDPINTIRNDTTNIFRSILAQCALLPDGNIAEPLLEAFNKSNNQGPGQSEFTLEATLEVLREVLSSRDDQITMVFDALDELSDYESFLESLRAIQIPGKKLRIFFSSRFGIDITPLFPEIVRLPISSQTATDVSSFVEKEIKKRWTRSGITESQAVRLKRALIMWSEGVFRWVALELEIFLPPSRRQGPKVRPADFEARLLKLERSRAPAVDRMFLAYDQIYQDALGEVDEYSRRRIVNATMKWVLCTFRPFHVAELVTVVSLAATHMQTGYDNSGDGSSSVQLPGAYPDPDPVSAEELLAYCANFITTTNKGIVRLAHLSVRQYFEGKRAADFSPKQQHLEAAILSVRGMSGQLQGIANTSVAEYFAKVWPIHSRAAADAPELKLLLQSDEILGYLEEDDLRLKIALHDDLNERDCLGNTTLHDAVLSGSRDDVELVLQVHTFFQQQSPLVKEKNSNGDTPLHIAASHGCETSFTALVHAGSSISEMNEFGLTPLHVAVLFGQQNIIKAASQFSWSLDAVDGNGGTPLHTAAACGSIDIGRLLINSGMDISHRDRENKTALDIANKSNDIDFIAMVKSLSGVEVAVNTDERHPSGSPSTSRPRIHVDSQPVCQYCNVEEWLEGSRQGLRHPFSLSLTALEQSADNCSLCRYFWNSIQKYTKNESSVYNYGAGSAEITVGVTLAADSQTSMTSQDLLSIYYGQRLAGQLEFCVKPDDVLATTDLSFTVGRSTHGFENSLKIAKGWLDDCRKTHTSCSIQSHPPLFARLIEIAEEEGPCCLRLVRCRDIQTQQRSYVYLSFTWGDCDYVDRTRNENFTQRSSTGFSTEELSRLFRDAVVACRSLGYRYLYVDALCIIQDSIEDLEEQMPAMASLVSAADLVLASTGKDAQEPLSDDSHQSELITRLDCHLSGSEKPFVLNLRAPFPTASDVMYKTVLSRTWRAQEALLVGKLLIFSSDHPMWNCTTLLRTEASSKAHTPVYRNIPSLYHDMHSMYGSSAQKLPWADKGSLYFEWYRYVEMISSGELKFPSDLLPATEAVAKAVHSIVSTVSGEALEEVERSYHQGIRSDDLHRSLLWMNKETHDGKDFSLIGTEIASWSWASRAGWKSYRLVSSVVLHPDAQLKDLELLQIFKDETLHLSRTRIFNGKEQLIYSTDLFKPRQLLVKAYVQSFSSSRMLRMYDLFFDTREVRRAWRAGQNLLFMVVSRWAYTASKHSHRWIGLILQVTEQPHHFGAGESEDGNLSGRTEGEEPVRIRFPDTYLRAGLFLGPKCEDGLANWSSQTILLV